jgi:hypothetical protein
MHVTTDFPKTKQCGSACGSHTDMLEHILALSNSILVQRSSRLFRALFSLIAKAETQSASYCDRHLHMQDSGHARAAARAHAIPFAAAIISSGTGKVAGKVTTKWPRRRLVSEQVVT